MRRVIAFTCDGSRLVGTLDDAAGATGVLIVSGGNEVRWGAHRGMAMLAGVLASAGIPVLRFDRRGVGDSGGANGGHASSGPDIAAALATFRHEQPHLSRVIGFGNCDAATALLLFDRGCDALVLANPWLGDEDAPLPPAALRAHYRARLIDPNAWIRVVRRGGSGIGPALRSLFVRRRGQPLARQVADLLGSRPTTILLAGGDRTAQVFADGVRVPDAVTVETLDTASHSFAGRGETLARILIDTVRSIDDKSAT